MKQKVPAFTQNRELSWLRFNLRVLEEAIDPDVPLYERLRFVAIFQSNLEEFFMVRVGSLYHLLKSDPPINDDKSGMSPAQQLAAIYEASAPLGKKCDENYKNVLGLLRDAGVECAVIEMLSREDMRFLRQFFINSILPLLSPQLYAPGTALPHMPGGQPYLAVRVKDHGNTWLGLVPLPPNLPAAVFLPGAAMRFIPTQQILVHFADMLFDHKISGCTVISVTRADVADHEIFDEAADDDRRAAMQKTLKKRRNQAAVRLQCSRDLPDAMLSPLLSTLQLARDQVFATAVPFRLDRICDMLSPRLSAQSALKWPPLEPPAPDGLAPRRIARQVRRRDRLIICPFESFEPFLTLVEEAAADPHVTAISITVYRLSRDSRLVKSLCNAVKNGKCVTVVIELRARFDEQNNIDWSQTLQEAGCRVVFGPPDYKLHAKLCLVSYKNASAITYVGTGNFNETTCRQYTDIGLLTADHNIAADAEAFFTRIAAGVYIGRYRFLLAAPNELRPRLLDMIAEQTALGANGYIFMKLNGLTDMDIMRALRDASRAGVRIELNVRGICCLLPGVPGHTENIKVFSVVGRFLEHARIYVFGREGRREMWISSADMMTRNTRRRVEIACPIYNRAVQVRIWFWIDLLLRDTKKARSLSPQGEWEQMCEDNAECLDSQQEMLARPALRRSYLKTIKEFLAHRH
ncbi:MAG: polyphosphate kinase 1 [Clostridia bacterium]|nr:polyphosphate kinase 1 [Clostridia bacterium]